ncbi:hypothetical protein BN7_3602 [Wickerhamomyces ciferrii]|uniref:Calcineurin-like phosphoesterase domain-containing protein n=1 Tax=Wickerhamomyces ciferrii (strain ATCC 14091 / BCRC 22168 / CBS 111 / JCM 3599 / NBRC 0793 / NRRL Y-1031 F-60-10) TaxID=1206466 RepID=K0KRR8_WICCF|nr:uncharacterized protein BN7_3602 [Wickerhamomyces ciferrii]CCH44043.1 hypothetical protein BN7_3602 [Wickerhamomyces ciferrii]
MSRDYQTIESELIDETTNYQSSFKKIKYIIFSILTIPFIIYLFIILPTQETERINLPRLNKFDKLSKPLTKTNERLIIIGDVHGSLKPLKNLIEKVEFNNEMDQVILLGDYLSKGPDSIGVLDYAMENGFKGILGNHELSILAKYQGSKNLYFQDDDLYNLTKKTIDGPKKIDKEIMIAKKLTPEHINYITSMPIFLELGLVSSFTNHENKWNSPINGIASHLGINIDKKTIENQKIMDQLQLNKYWFKDYNNYEKTIDKKHRNIIFYGHYAGLGLNLNKYSKGLDSGCVYGGELTAMVIYIEKEHDELVYKHDVVSVKC